jgi:hypothetical protein
VIEGLPLFITFNLQGALPIAGSPRPRKLTSGQAFAWMDRALDHPKQGPPHLKRRDIAQAIADCIHRGAEEGFLELEAWVIMPNHVHLLIQPNTSPDRILRSLNDYRLKAGRMDTTESRGGG